MIHVGQRVTFSFRAAFALLTAGLVCGCNMMNGYVMNESGNGYYKQGNYSMARHEFRKAVADDPNNPTYIHNLASSMQKQGDMMGAEQTYRAALQLDPMHQPSYHGLASLMIKQHRHAEAQELMQAWVDTQPYAPAAHIEMAWLQREIGNPLASETALQNALRVDPGNATAMAQLGQIYHDRGDSGRAVAMYQRSLYANWNQPEVQSRVASLTGTSHPGGPRIAARPVTPPAIAYGPAPMVTYVPQPAVMPYGATSVTMGHPLPTYGGTTAMAQPMPIISAQPIQLQGPAFAADPAHVPQVGSSIPVVEPY